MDDRRPTVIADGVHVTYRVQGVKPASAQAGASATTALRRILPLRRDAGIQQVRAVRGVSFIAYEGDAIGLIGRNGSGKSTLLQAVAGLLPLAGGTIYTSARPSLLGVNAALMPQLSGERNIEIGSLAMGLSRAEAAERAEAIAEFAGLGEFLYYPMTTYSSGMSARLRFAIAASVTHEILLIDEALATGDADFQKRSQERIKELRDEAGTVFLVSHSAGVVRETCTRAIWLEGGLIRLDGPADEVVSAYEADVAARTAQRQAGKAP